MPENQIVYGGLTFNFVSAGGNIDLPGMTLEAIEKRGVDGVAFLENAFRAEPSPIYLRVLVSSYAALQQAVADMKNLQGTQVTFYDATGLSYSGVVITNTRHTNTRRVLNATWLGTHYASGYMATFSMTMHYPYGSF